jgi:hypothetical protein
MLLGNLWRCAHRKSMLMIQQDPDDEIWFLAET